MTDLDPQAILDRLLARSAGTACRRPKPDDYDETIAAQDTIETGSQVVGADDDYA